MSATFTPGPWSMDEECQICAGNEVVAVVRPRLLDANTWDWDRALLDARLIAAAPDLLEALEILVGDGDLGLGMSFGERISNAKAAIAAAKGQA